MGLRAETRAGRAFGPERAGQGGGTETGADYCMLMIQFLSPSVAEVRFVARTEFGQETLLWADFHDFCRK